MTSLPFTPEPAAIARWLTDLERDGVKTQARALYQAVKALNEAGLDQELRLSVLEAVRAPVFAVSDRLAREFARSSAGWEASPRNTAKLSAFLHHELAAGYELLSGPVAGQRTMASLGQMILRVLQMGEPISSAVWRRLYRCYSEGMERDWLAQPVEDPLQKGRISPLQQFQWVLAFVALAPMRFDPAAMEGIYALFPRGVIAVKFSVSDAGWYFDPDKPRGPCRAERVTGQPGRGSYLSMSLSQRPETISDEVWLRLQHHIGQPAEAAYPVERRIDEVWLGWQTIITELSRRQSLRSSMGWLEVPEFEVVVPDGHEQVASGNDRIHRHVKATLKQSRGDRRAILETEVKLPGGDLAALKFLDGTLRLALVRWAHPGWFGNPGRFGLDLFASRVFLVKTIVPKLGPNDAILISQDNEGDLLLLPPVKLKPGMEVLLGDSEARIARLLEWTDSFCAYRLVP